MAISDIQGVGGNVELEEDGKTERQGYTITDPNEDRFRENSRAAGYAADKQQLALLALPAARPDEHIDMPLRAPVA